MFDDLNDLYQQVILDHCKKPRNFHEMARPTCSAQGHNPLCGDRLQLFLEMQGDTIKDISFVGSGCCISKASASLLTESVKGKVKADVQKMFDQFHEMITTGAAQGDFGKLAVFAGVHLIGRNFWMESGAPVMVLVFAGACLGQLASVAIATLVASRSPVWQHWLRYGLLEAGMAALASPLVFACVRWEKRMLRLT